MRLSPRRIATLAAATLGAWLLAPAASHAGDHKIFPGSFCHQSNTDTVGLEYNYSIYNGILISRGARRHLGRRGLELQLPHPARQPFQHRRIQVLHLGQRLLG